MVSKCLAECGLGSDYLSWMPIIALALLSVTLFLSLLYMFGRAFGRREWEALAKTELYQTAIAAVWVVMISAFALSACSVSCGLTGGKGPFASALTYLNNIQENIRTVTEGFLNAAMKLRIGAAIAIPGGGGSNTWRPYAGCSIVADNLEQLAVMLTPFIGSLIVQKISLSIIAAFVFKLLLPVGVILRIVPFARETGALLLAVAVALYIVLPLTYLFALRATLGVISPNVPTISMLDCTAQSATENIFATVGAILPQAVFFPALSMIITIASARVLTKIFQYDFQEMMH